MNYQQEWESRNILQREAVLATARVVPCTCGDCFICWVKQQTRDGVIKDAFSSIVRGH